MNSSIRGWRRAIALSLGAVALMPLTAAPARAGSHYINANICMPEQEEHAYRTAAGLYNTSGSELLNVNCSIPNDAVLSHPKVRVRGYDWDVDGMHSFSCTVFVRGSTENLEWLSGDAVDAQPYSGPYSQLITVDSLSQIPQTMVGPEKAISMHCVLPPYSELYNMRVGSDTDF